jgi:polyhydroxyalkanoate synthase
MPLPSNRFAPHASPASHKAQRMNDFKLDPEQLRIDVAQLQQQAAELVSKLATIRDVEIGSTPKDAVYHEDKLTLYRYRAMASTESSTQAPDKERGPAILICYAMINRPYMMDLQPDRSLIRRLLERGIDVFLIDWGTPDGADRFLDFNDYVNRYMLHCVNKVCELRDEPQVNLVGVCQGGALSLCFTALHPQRVRNLITMVTPVDCQTPDDVLSKWVRQLDVPALVAAHGNIPGEWLNAGFATLMPFRLLSQKYVSMLDMVGDRDKLENFLRMEKWIFDSPDQPGAMFEEFITNLYQHNRLIKGELQIAGRTVNLSSITQPVFNVYATEDHLVPPAASRCLEQLVGSKDYSELAVNGGHIGLYVSGKAQVSVPTAIAQWLHERH